MRFFKKIIMSSWFEMMRPALSGGADLAGGVMGLASGYGSARATLMAGERNAEVYELLARTAMADGGENARRMRRNQADAVGGALADVGARNMAADGSGLKGAMTAAARYEQEINDLAVASVRQATDYSNQARMARWEAKQASKGKRMGGLGSLLGGALKAGGTIAGAYFGGPVGASVGGAVGGAVGGGY